MNKTIIFPSDVKNVHAEYRRKLRELRQRQKETLARLFEAYYFAEDEEERTTIETKILVILEDERGR